MFNKKADSSQLFDNPIDVQAQAGEPKRPEISIDMQGLETAKDKVSNSIIDEWLTMTGDLESEGDILVRGKVRGNVRCKLLIIDEQATIDGGLVAEEVIVRGTTKGTMRANRVIFSETARVDSEIFHRAFAVEEGACIKGALHHCDDPMNDKSMAAKPGAGANASDKADKAAA